MIISPEVSVIMFIGIQNTPDSVDHVQAAITSILDQHYLDYELIILDYAADQCIKELCATYAKRDIRIHYLAYQDKGKKNLAMIYNEGIAQSRGTFIAFMDPSCRWYSTTLASLICYFKRSNYIGMVYGILKLSKQHKNLGETWSMRKIKKRELFHMNAVLVKREALDFVGGFDESPEMDAVFTRELWLRIGRRFVVEKFHVLIGETDEKARQYPEEMLQKPYLRKQPSQLGFKPGCFKLNQIPRMIFTIIPFFPRRILFSLYRRLRESYHAIHSGR